MTTARYLVGDVFDRMAELPDGSVDLVLTSPPFLALRSYLPDGHPDKAKEIGSEATPAEFLDTLLALTAEWGRLLAPHGSICVELGDTYAGSGGAGGDYGPDGLRAGQERFDGSARRTRHIGTIHSPYSNPADWPPEKSLCFTPSLYAASLAYGRNLLTGTESPAGQWRVRNLVAWVRPNPPVGALGDKFRPATSYLTIACRARDRYFDLDAVRTPYAPGTLKQYAVSDASDPTGTQRPTKGDGPKEQVTGWQQEQRLTHAGAPPLDWWNHVDTLIDDEIRARAGKPSSPIGTARGNNTKGTDAGSHRFAERVNTSATIGAQGSHIRRRLEQAGYLGGPGDDVWDIAPSGYPGAHYAVYPPELCVRPILAMTPTRVCLTCGQPSRRLTDPFTLDSYRASVRPQTIRAVALADEHGLTDAHIAAVRAFGTSDAGKATTLNNGAGKNSDQVKALAAEAKAVLGGYFREFVQSTTAERTSTWSDCGHDTWRPGHVLDPFAGSGTTLAVATGHSRQATGIDLDPRNAQLAQERCGMFLTIEEQVAS